MLEVQAPSPGFAASEFHIAVATDPWAIAASRALRRAVFCDEQHLFDGDDGDDIDEHAIVLVAFARVAVIDDQVVGTVRIHETAPGEWVGSRLAVHRGVRRIAGIGTELIRLAVGTAQARGCTRFRAHVQQANVKLFQRLHWQSLDHVMLQGQPHELMQADLRCYPPHPGGDITLLRALDGSVTLIRLADDLRRGRGLAHKHDIAPVVARLGVAGGTLVPVGDDTAAIPDGDGYLLFAIEGFLNELVAADPWFAGYCGVMVNLSDIAAMGGRPTAIVDAVWSNGLEAAEQILDGLAAASSRYNVPVVGGHTNTRSDRGQLSVAVLGRATSLLTSFDAKPGDRLIAAIDLRGRYREPNPYWDASTTADPARLRGDLDLLAEIAESGLCRAAKDVSMGGVIGTALMLLECSHVGATIDVRAVPRPQGAPLLRWLSSFPSFGFLLSAPEESCDAILARFAARDIAAAVIGGCDDTGQVRLVDGEHEAPFWDFSQTSLIGCGVEVAHA
jgi:AIR synthase-related protein/putative N-acetyltransferase (TIGR04045 family)